MTMLAPPVTRGGRSGTIYWTGVGLLLLLFVLLLVQAYSVGLGFIEAIRNPLELDYGEGIVWQQAALIPGPRAYSADRALPFIVFHYPPVFHLLTRAVAAVMPTMLAAGRLVSSVSTVAAAVLVAALVHAATPLANAGANRGSRGMPVAIAIAAGLLALSLHVVRTWGMFMRVDMVAVALGLAGLLVAARADGRFWGTLVALLLCLASVYAKQTQLAAGVAVVLVAVVRRPRPALAATAVALAVGLGVLAVLEIRTGGGFLLNIVGDNVNRFDIRHAYWVFVPERTSWPLFPLMLFAAGWILLRLWRLHASGTRRLSVRAVGQVVPILRLLDRERAARVMLVLYFLLAGLIVVASMFKSGGNFNYLLDWLCAGCVLLGIVWCDLLATRRGFPIMTALLLLTVLGEPLHLRPARPSPERLAANAALVARIARATKPVASENMTVLMQAGKPVIFEPSIVTELALTGHWDEAPLVRMIRDHGFAFMITTDNTSRTTPAVLAAMHAAYPRVERVGPKLFLNLPPAADPTAQPDPERIKTSP